MNFTALMGIGIGYLMFDEKGKKLSKKGADVINETINKSLKEMKAKKKDVTSKE